MDSFTCLHDNCYHLTSFEGKSDCLIKLSDLLGIVDVACLSKRQAYSTR